MLFLLPSAATFQQICHLSPVQIFFHIFLKASCCCLGMEKFAGSQRPQCPGSISFHLHDISFHLHFHDTRHQQPGRWTSCPLQVTTLHLLCGEFACLTWENLPSRNLSVYYLSLARKHKPPPSTGGEFSSTQLAERRIDLASISFLTSHCLICSPGASHF